MKFETRIAVFGPALLLWFAAVIHGGHSAQLTGGVAFALLGLALLLASCVGYVVAVWPSSALTSGIESAPARVVVFILISTAIGYLAGLPLNAHPYTSILVLSQSIAKLLANAFVHRKSHGGTPGS